MKQLKKILYIDDDAMMRMMVQKSIERGNKGFEVIACATPSEFLSHLSTFSPDLLMIDVVMPLKAGPDLLKEVRELSHTIPAVFMTGHEKFEPDNKKDLEPVIGIIQKPFPAATLCDDLLRLWEDHFIN